MNVICVFSFFFLFSRTSFDGSEAKLTRQAQGAPSLSDQCVGGDKKKIVYESSYKKIEEKRMEALNILKATSVSW